MHQIRRLQIILLIVLGLAGGLTPAFGAKEGFGGMGKATVELSRKRPPDVYITGTRVAVRPAGRGGSVERQLATSLLSELLGNDPRFKLDTEHPQTLIEVSLLENQFNERWETRGSGKYTSRYKVITQVFSVAYRALDQRNGDSISADNVLRKWSEDYLDGNGAPARAQVENDAVTFTVHQIAQRLSPTVEKVGVLLPKGSLKDFIRLAKSGLWNRYLESLESLPPRSTRTDESYRQYGIGVAYEALGYAAEDPEIALSYLEEAALHYNAALEANPREKFFAKGYRESQILANWTALASDGDTSPKEAMAPVDRVRSALAQYQRVMDLRDAEPMIAGDGAKAIKGDAESTVTNESVIAMAQAGLPDDVILTTLETAQATRFDTSPQGLIVLAEAKVSPKVIKRMQAIAAGQ